MNNSHYAGLYKSIMVGVFIAALCLGALLSACAQISSQAPTDGNEGSTIDEIIFIGEIISLEDGKDGSTAQLKNATGQMVDVVISTANLDPDSEFDADKLKVGNFLKISGTPFPLASTARMVPSRVLSYTPFNIAEQVATDTEQAKCAALGGTVRRAGMAGFERCIQNYADGGKICRDEADCFGYCLLDQNQMASNLGRPLSGSCALTDNPFGCHNMIKNGKAVGICID